MFIWPCDRSKVVITDNFLDHKNRKGYIGTLANDLASLGGKKLPLFASISGKIVVAGWNKTGYGNEVYIKNDSEKVQTAHMDSISVKVGDQVTAGQMIGIMGATGNSTGVHVHWACWILRSGKWINIDPIGEGLIGGEPATSPESPALTEVFQVGDKIRLKLDKPYVNLRIAPTIQALDIGDFLPGDTAVVQKISGDWLCIYALPGGFEVWLHGSYVEKM